MKPGTVYCYHCRLQHPREDMRLVITKTGKRWRCFKSIEAAKADKGKREEFGRIVSANNKAEAQAKMSSRIKADAQVSTK